MSVEEISDEFLAALAQLVQDGKDLANGWDVSQISLPNITGGQY